jgi:hypothetical protein
VLTVVALHSDSTVVVCSARCKAAKSRSTNILGEDFNHLLLCSPLSAQRHAVCSQQVRALIAAQVTVLEQLVALIVFCEPGYDRFLEAPALHIMHIMHVRHVLSSGRACKLARSSSRLHSCSERRRETKLLPGLANALHFPVMLFCCTHCYCLLHSKHTRPS